VLQLTARDSARQVVRAVSEGGDCHSTISSNLGSECQSIGGEPQQIMTYFMLRISDYVYIGPNTHIRAAEIKSNVYIGANCTIGNMVMIKDNVKILDGTVLPANTVWAGGTIIAGRPGRVVGEIGEGWASSGTSGSTIDEGVGVRSRERWAAVGNKR